MGRSKRRSGSLTRPYIRWPPKTVIPMAGEIDLATVAEIAEYRQQNENLDK